MNRDERGGVFFYIFLCIGLLAALAYAVAQGGRGTVTSLSGDKARLAATEIISFADVMDKTVTQLRLRGSLETELSFANDFLSAGYGNAGDVPADEIFNPAGGAAVYQSPPDDATASAQEYRFLANNMIDNIGTTCGASDCVDLVMALFDVRQEVCEALNTLLGVTNPPAADTAMDGDILFSSGTDPFAHAGTETVGDEDPALLGQSEACFHENAAQYIYYKVLLAR